MIVRSSALPGVAKVVQSSAQVLRATTLSTLSMASKRIPCLSTGFTTAKPTVQEVPYVPGSTLQPGDMSLLHSDDLSEVGSEEGDNSGGKAFTQGLKSLMNNLNNMVAQEHESMV